MWPVSTTAGPPPPSGHSRGTCEALGRPCDVHGLRVSADGRGCHAWAEQGCCWAGSHTQDGPRPPSLSRPRARSPARSPRAPVSEARSRGASAKAAGSSQSETSRWTRNSAVSRPVSPASVTRVAPGAFASERAAVPPGVGGAPDGARGARRWGRDARSSVSPVVTAAAAQDLSVLPGHQRRGKLVPTFRKDGAPAAANAPSGGR